MKKIVFVCLCGLLLLTGCKKEHFISDRQYRNQVHDDFLNRQELAKGCADRLFGVMDSLPMAEREALEFLYAYMPYSDLADYDGEFFLQQVRTAFEARDTFAWGKDIPEDVFRHFVLVYRVNNENLDTARTYFFHQLKDRIKGMSMEEAALEVNHWCHEHVAYRAADARTSAPLATLRTGLGRCGEESTFTVTALRSVGIPARQCYTPRWAHCDDNHAWVEVWSNGEWKFLGACEPDPELNMGWFAVPSTRCMMVHTKAFGRYHGDEEVVVSTPLYSELNLLEHYAPTKRISVTVKTPQEEIVEGAHVKFKLYNYSEYYTLADVVTDKDGQAQLTTGLGDLLIWANKGDQYNYVKMDVRQSEKIDIYISREPGTAYIDELEIVPPVAGEAKVTPSEESVAKNARRIAYEDSIRAAYAATFPSDEEILKHRNLNLSDKQLLEIVKKSEGNYSEIFAFLDNHQLGDENIHLDLYLPSFSDKDLRDIPASALEEHLPNVNSRNARYSESIYAKGIFPARISNELITPWRKALKEALQNEETAFAQDEVDYNTLIAWCKKSISVDDTGNYYNCPISPMGVFRLRHSDAHSRDIFFVAACRSLDIPAYLDNATNTLYVWGQDDWHKVNLQTQENPSSSAATGMLTLTYSGKEPAKPIYYPHFTLQKYQDGDFVSFDFEGDPRMESFPATLALEPGYYCLSTGNRYAEGDVLSRLEFFEIKAGEKTDKEIVIRPLQDRLAETSSAKMDLSTPIVEDATLADYASDKGVLFILLGDYQEPSKHLVKELAEQKGALANWGGMTYLEAPATAKALSWNFPNTDCYLSDGQHPSVIEKSLTKALNLDLKGDYPLVALVAPNGTIKFHSHGYKIGLAELIAKNL